MKYLRLFEEFRGFESSKRLIIENEEYINSIKKLINTFDETNIDMAFQIMKGLKIKQSVILDEYKELFEIFKLKPSKLNLFKISNRREVKVKSSSGGYRESVPDILFKMPKLDYITTFVNNLDNLKSFDKTMIIEIGNQTSIPNLTHIGEDLNIYGGIDAMPKLKSVGNMLYLSSSKIRSLPALEYVGSNLILGRSIIESLPKLEYVGNNLDLFHSPIKSLPMLKYVGGHLNLARSAEIDLLVQQRVIVLKAIDNKISSLPMLSHVGYDLYLDNTQIESLTKGLYVGRDLYLRKTPLSKTTTEEELRKQINVKGKIYL